MKPLTAIAAFWFVLGLSGTAQEKPKVNSSYMIQVKTAPGSGQLSQLDRVTKELAKRYAPAPLDVACLPAVTQDSDWELVFDGRTPVDPQPLMAALKSYGIRYLQIIALEGDASRDRNGMWLTCRESKARVRLVNTAKGPKDKVDPPDLLGTIDGWNKESKGAIVISGKLSVVDRVITVTLEKAELTEKGEERK